MEKEMFKKDELGIIPINAHKKIVSDIMEMIIKGDLSKKENRERFDSMIKENPELLDNISEIAFISFVKKIAYNCGDFDTKEYLIEKYKLDINSKDNKGNSALHWAVFCNSKQTVDYLIYFNIDVNLKDNDGWTALMYAVRYSESYECVEELLQAGADSTIRNNYGSSAIILSACYNKNSKILKKLFEKYKSSDKEVLRAMIFLLTEHNISEEQQLSMLQIFMDESVPLNVLYEGKTPLMYAASFGNSTKLIKMLLDNQASPTLRSTEGKTAFDYAMKNNNLAHDETYWALNKR